MELKGKIIKVLEIQTGQNKKGAAWMNQSFILEIPDSKYPKKVCLQLWGQDKIEKYDLEEGLTVTAHIELESREYAGRWYTDVRAWKVTWDADQKRKWTPGASAGKAEPLKGTSASEEEDTTLRGHYEGMGSGPLDNSLPF